VLLSHPKNVEFILVGFESTEREKNKLVKMGEDVYKKGIWRNEFLTFVWI
jgi:hypothetical protein